MSQDKEYFGGRYVEMTDLHREDRQRLRPIVGACLLGALLFVLAKCAFGQAQLPLPTKVQDLFAAAVKHGGYEAKCQSRMGGCPIPAVVIVGLDDDNVAGQFDPRHPNFVRVNGNNQSPGLLSFNTVVVHEFVHYLQWLFGELGPQTGCADILRIEEQAYKAAAAYLAEFGIVKDYSEQLGSVAFMAMLCMAGGM